MHPGELAERERSEHLARLSRDELGLAFAKAVQAARAGGDTDRPRPKGLVWLQDPALAAVLDEFRRRGLDVRTESYRMHEVWSALSAA